MNDVKWRRKGFFVLISALAALFISGCSSRAAALAGSSWPGLTQNGDLGYLAFQNTVRAIDLESCETGGCDAEWQYSAVSTRRSLIGGRRPVQFYAEPAIGDGLVVVGDYSETLHAIDAETGQGEWTFSTDRARFIGGATIGDGVVYAGAVDGNLYALNADDGELIWRFHAESQIWDAPLLEGDVLYVPSLDHRLYAVSAASGREIWNFEADGALVSAPTLEDDVLYFGAFDRVVYAVDAENGREIWSKEVSDWVWDSPAVSDGMLILGDLSGNVYGLDSEDGSQVWQTEVAGTVVSTPLIEDGIAYLGSGTATGQPVGRIYAFDIDTGQERWQTAIQTEETSRFLVFDTGTRVTEVPIYGPLQWRDDKLLVSLQRGDDLLQAIDVSGGTTAWSGLGNATSAPANSSSGDGSEDEEDSPTTTEFLIRWLPLYILMTLLMVMFMRRRQSE